MMENVIVEIAYISLGSSFLLSDSQCLIIPHIRNLFNIGVSKDQNDTRITLYFRKQSVEYLVGIIIYKLYHWSVSLGTSKLAL